MTSRSLRWLCASAALSLALCGCAGQTDTDLAKNSQTELAQSLIEAANASLSGNDAVTAASYYRAALDRAPDNAEAAIGLMQSLRLTGNLDEARQVADKALAANPKNAAVAAEAGKVKLATGQAQEAIALLNRADAADPKDWRSRSALGMAFDRLGQYGRADESYRAALAISPDNPAVLNNYALSRVMANDVAGARRLLEQAASVPNADLRVRQNLALVYALSGDMAKAEEMARRDLPPAMLQQELTYYRQLAARASRPGGASAAPLSDSSDRSAVDRLAPAIVSAFPPPSLPPAPVVATAVPPPPPAAAAVKAAPPKTPPLAVAAAKPRPLRQAAGGPPPHPARPAGPPAPEMVAASRYADHRPADPHVAANRFTVQLASFVTEAAAKRELALLKTDGTKMTIMHVPDRRGRKWFVIRAGDFARSGDARHLLDFVHARGCADAFVVPRGSSSQEKA